MLLKYNDNRQVFYADPKEMSVADVPVAQEAGLQWFDEAKLWVTTDQYRVANLFFNTECRVDDTVFVKSSDMFKSIRASRAKEAYENIISPKRLKYMDFQSGGVTAACDRLSANKAVLIADPMGLGKTVEACGIINHNMYDPQRVLVVCPASLRINWQRELDKWLTWPAPAFPVLTARESGYRVGPLIISYQLATDIKWFKHITTQQWDLVIFDESHYLKNPEAKRTKACLTGIASRTDNVVLMSGTPIPNRAHEFWAILNSVAPDVTGGLTEQQFTRRYTTGEQGKFGWQITGGRNHGELNCRLRGSGFMIRRDKREVLPQLPPERPNLVIFPQNAATAEIIRKEQDNVQFTADEILNAGQPLGYGALPELRKEMGIEKLPDSIDWIKDQLEAGVDKLVVFGYHQEVLEGLRDGLKKYKPELVYGKTIMKRRQAAVDRFQEDPECRVIIGGWEPLGVGWTLTAADTIVFVESSFVPKDNNQAKDRLIRIGQEASSINIYYLVVEGSIDATVMAKAVKKEYDINLVLK